MPSLPDFSMEFQPSSIEHLGLRLYSTLPPVIAELVSNAYDAEAPKVEVFMPSGPLTLGAEVVVRDFGHGMSAEELQTEFLPIGRNRRGDDSSRTMSKTGMRRVTGRKGLGKLSGLGIADEMEVRSIQDGQAVCLRLRYPEMREWSKNHGSAPYKPTVVEERTGATTEPSGVEITLRSLRRKSPIDAIEIRRGLARRLTFIGPKFELRVNGSEIQPGDRTSQASCDIAWEVVDRPEGATIAAGVVVRGWLGFLAKSSQTGRGIDIFANDKAVELGSFFNLGTTHAQFARAHLVGEVHADFLDEAEDLASTARTSVVWESALGQQLQAWGQRLLTTAFGSWLEHRQKERHTQVITAGKFDEWLLTRSAAERKVATRLVKLLAENEDLEPAGVVPLLELVKGSVESIAFSELVDAMEAGATVEGLLRLFGDWRVIEAREHLRLADGRLAAIEQLSKFIRDGALEVSELQPLLTDNLWLLDAGWSNAYVEARYSELLRSVPEPKDFEDVDRRLDIIGVLDAQRLTVVELKRPEVTLNFAHLVQIERYTLWARSQFGSSTGSDSKSVDGLLLVGKMSTDPTVLAKLTFMHAQGIRVQTLQELVIRGGEYFRQLETRLVAVAPEYAKARRKAKRDAAKP